MGRPVLVEFWTFTCFNWIRTLPYVRSSFENYRDAGLVVLGVHSRGRSPGREGPGGRVSDRRGRRLRDLERVRQQLLARRLLRRRGRTDPPPTVRGGRLPVLGDRHPASAGGCRNRRRQPEVGPGRSPGDRGSGRLGGSEISRDLHRLRPRRELLIAGRPAAAQSLDARRRLDGWAAGGRAERAGWPDRTSLPRARSSPGDGARPRHVGDRGRCRRRVDAEGCTAARAARGRAVRAARPPRRRSPLPCCRGAARRPG